MNEKSNGGDGTPSSERGLYVVSLSLHGLLRGRDIELGRDADTGGQILYVVDQAKALARHPRVERVELITREVVDKRVDASYAEPREELVPGAEIVRLPFGPRRYLHKERLWPYLDGLVDRIVHHLRGQERMPDIIHGHYADAGYAGSRVADLLGVPFVYTGHSLGRVKRERLLENGLSPSTIEKRYSITTRIEAEEQALVSAALVIASTKQEVAEQYALYEQYEPDRMTVNPPGVDLTRFSPPDGTERSLPIAAELRRFLTDPEKPMVLAIARPDERKNLSALVEAFAITPGLRERANLVVVAGNRDEIARLDPGARRVLRRILGLVDTHDLYGSVAYPKRHRPQDVPALYRLASLSRGVFVNVALTEPFGLTLIEAAACGLPLVATRDGGPQDILERCQNGRLVDPQDTEAIGKAILDAVTDGDQWDEWSANAMRGAHAYTWPNHVERYLEEVSEIREGSRPVPTLSDVEKSRLSTMNRILITDIDNTLTGNDEATEAFLRFLESTDDSFGFGIATGRTVEQAMAVLNEHGIPAPDILITSVGTEIYYGARRTLDRSWTRHIDHLWNPAAVREVLDGLPGLAEQPRENQRRFKVSYMLDPERAPSPREILRHLRNHSLKVRMIVSHGIYIDIVPVRASSGLALRSLSLKWGLSPERFLIVGDSGNDEEMLSGDTLGVVVANYSPELEKLRNRPRIYFAEGEYAWGILEGIRHYTFMDEIRIPGEEPSEHHSGVSA